MNERKFFTTEHISEKIAELLAEKINIKSAQIDIGTYKNRIGCMSYLINSKGESLIEGVSLIARYYPSYDQYSLYDDEKNEYYSMEMIFNSVAEYDLREELIKIMIFDSLIGNSDRHHSNWAVLQDSKDTMICPIYDNGSFLCFCLPEEQIKNGKEK